MQKVISLETAYSEYGTFFTDDFARRVFTLTANFPQVNSIVFTLVAEWRSISYAVALPTQYPSSLKSFVDGFVNNSTNYTSAGVIADVVIGRLVKDMPELDMSARDQRAIRNKLKQLAQEAESARKTTIEFDEEAIWRDYLSMHVVQLGIHGMLKMGYLGLYSAYENFLVKLMRLIQEQDVRVTDRNFDEQVRQCFGVKAGNVYINSDMSTIRKIRHSLVHAGGRLTDHLKKIDQLPVVVVDGELHIHPRHLRDLYKILSKAALVAIEECISKNSTDSTSEL